MASLFCHPSPTVVGMIVVVLLYYNETMIYSVERRPGRRSGTEKKDG